jgi:tetratricopeptide (TPR) repeat protein
LDEALAQPQDRRLAAIRQLRDRNPESTVYQRLLGRQYVAMMNSSAKQNNWKDALDYATEAICLGSDDLYMLYDHALLCLVLEDEAGYRDVCRNMVLQYGVSDDPYVVKQVGWTVALAPGAIGEYSDLIRRLQRAAERIGGPRSEVYRFYLGAVLVRAGLYAEAVAEFEKIERNLEAKGAYVSFSPAYNKFFLAICHAHLGQMDTARQYYDAGATDVRNLFRAQQEKETTSSVSWNRRLTLELLRKEAEALLKPVATETE